MNENNQFIPESLNIWDRIFNRYKKIIYRRGSEIWNRYPFGFKVSSIKTPYSRNFIEYKIIDRLTGSEKIKKEYLD